MNSFKFSLVMYGLPSPSTILPPGLYFSKISSRSSRTFLSTSPSADIVRKLNRFNNYKLFLELYIKLKAQNDGISGRCQHFTDREASSPALVSLRPPSRAVAERRALGSHRQGLQDAKRHGIGAGPHPLLLHAPLARGPVGHRKATKVQNRPAKASVSLGGSYLSEERLQVWLVQPV